MQHETQIQKQIDRFEAGLETMKRLLDGVSKEALVQRMVPGKWTFGECLSHLADFEAINADRMKRTIAEKTPLLMNADEEAYAAALFYDQRDPENELAVFNTSRKQMLQILQKLADQTFHKTGVHNQAGKMSVLTWVIRSASHAEHHFKHMDDKRKALGLPMLGLTFPSEYPPK